MKEYAEIRTQLIYGLKTKDKLAYGIDEKLRKSNCNSKVYHFLPNNKKIPKLRLISMNYFLTATTSRPLALDLPHCLTLNQTCTNMQTICT